MNNILKSMRVKVHRFDGTNVEDWVYKISKFFDLHAVPPNTRLSLIAFHLEGPPSPGSNGWKRAVDLLIGIRFS